LAEPPARPGLTLFRMLRADSLLPSSVILWAMVLAAGAVVLEALLFRGLLDIGRELNLAGQRLCAIGMLLIFVLALLCLERPILSALLRLGRRLELRLRLAFLEKIPR